MAGASGTWHAGQAMDAPVVLRSPIEGLYDISSEVVAGWWRSATNVVDATTVGLTIPEITVRGIDRTAENRAMADAIRRQKFILAALALFAVGAALTMRKI